MKRLIAGLLLAMGALIFAGCNGLSEGADKPDAPTNVRVNPLDSSVVVTWDMEPDVEYWVFSAAASSISTDNWTTLPQARATRAAVSPQIIAGLVNGTQYAFTVNGRKDDGPGGPGSASLSAIPRLSGQSWFAGTPLPSASLNGLTFVLGTTSPGIFTTVGAGGRIFTSIDGISWTTINSGITTDLFGVAFGSTRYVAVGRGGAMVVSVDGSAWTTLASGTTNDLNAMVSGNSGFVAVGAGGTILHSGDGGNWEVAPSGTTQNLYGVGFSPFANRYFAVGAQGTMLSSEDGSTWTAVNSGTTQDLRSFAHNGITNVAVGANGTLITSADAVTWATIAPVTSRTLNSITAGSQFVTVGAGGTIVTSVDAVNWNVVQSGVSNDLNAVLFGASGFSAVGVGGVILSSF